VPDLKLECNDFCLYLYISLTLIKGASGRSFVVCV